MRTLAIGSLFVLFALVATVNMTDSAFADDVKVDVQLAMGSGTPGCEVENECYLPYEVTVDVGGEVTWINDDALHTVTAGDITLDAVGVDYPNGFDSSILPAGQNFSHTFEVAGTYPYFCVVHPWMTGIVNVEAEAMHPKSLDDIMTVITPGDAMQGSPLSIDVAITELDGKELEHVNFKITAMQGDEIVLEKIEHAHKGTATVETGPLPMDASDEMPVSVTVELIGFGVDDITGPSGQLATKQVVPEFGTIAMMILGIAIVSIIAVTTRSRVIPRM